AAAGRPRRGPSRRARRAPLEAHDVPIGPALALVWAARPPCPRKVQTGRPESSETLSEGQRQVSSPPRSSGRRIRLGVASVVALAAVAAISSCSPAVQRRWLHGGRALDTRN